MRLSPAIERLNAINMRSVLVSQFVKFCIVGVLNTAINYAVFLLLLNYASLHFLIAGACGFMSGAISGFFINRSWTFNSSIAYGRGLLFYLLVGVVSLASHSAAQSLAAAAGVPHAWTQLAGIVVSTFVNFVLLRFFVFAKRNEKAPT